MKKSAWRLALSAILFAAWIGYLGYLAATAGKPVVLARPQFLEADLWVVAEVKADAAAADKPSELVSIKKVVWARQKDDRELKSLQVQGIRTILDLQTDLNRALEAVAKVSDAEVREQDKKAAEKKLELEKHFVWQGAGEYILPLTRPAGDNKAYVVTSLPRTPGFSGYAGRIYPATPATLQQLELLTKEFHP